MSRDRLIAVGISWAVMVAMLGGVVVFGAGTAAAGNTGSNIEIVDVKPSSGGDLVVTVEGTSSTSVSDFKFWYTDHGTSTSLGPTQYGDGKFKGATYTDGSTFTAGDPISSSTPKVSFTFDSANTDYNYVANPLQIKVTAGDASYSSADGANRAVFTANHYQISAKDAAGNSLSQFPVMFYNTSTNESLGTAFAAGTSTLSFGCQGVEVDGNCTNPDTDSAGTIHMPSGQTVTGPVSIQTFDIAGGDASAKVDPTRGATTLTADTETAVMFYQTIAITDSGTNPSPNEIVLSNADTGNTIARIDNSGGGGGGGGSAGGAPLFLRTNVKYNITFVNTDSFGTETRYLTQATGGMSETGFRIATSSVSTSTVTGQVVDESGNPVSDAVVIAEPDSGTNLFTDLYNSTTTDSNGLFTMELPENSELDPGFGYGFRLVGTDTSSGTPIYYPTPDTNEGEGYVVNSGKTVIPPMTIKKGGVVDVSLSGSLPGFAFTTLSQVSTAYPSLTRTANSNGFNQFSFSGNTPSGATVSLLSPTTGTDTQVAYNVWGLSSPKTVCANAVSVSQGSVTSSSCSLSSPNYLNLSVKQYDSIIQQSNSEYATVEDYGFFWENKLVIRDANNNDLVTFLGPGGAQQFFLDRPTNPNDIKIPVPDGDYEVELRPTNEFADRTSVNDTTTYSVSGGSTKNVQLDRGEAFRIEPVETRMDLPLTRSKDNTIAVEVYDPGTENELTGSDPVSVTAQLLNPDGTTASSEVSLSYDSSGKGVFETTTFNPSSLGVDAGSYKGKVTVTHTDGSRTYETTRTDPVRVTGFSTGIRLSSRTVSPGGTVLGQIYAFDSNGGITTSASDVDILVYNQNGKQVTATNPASGLSSGEGSFSLTMPDEPGRYRIATRITSGSSQGIAETDVTVNQLDVSVSTDRTVYAPDDPVSVTITATDATDGSAIADAPVEIAFTSQTLSRTTDANGEVQLTLDPDTYGTEGAWEHGHGISATVTHDTSTEIVRQTARTGFEVQQFEARAESTAETFTSSEKPTIDVFVPSSVTISSVTPYLDGEKVTANSISTPADGIRRVELDSQSVGEHVVTLQVTAGSGASQNATTQFAVQDNQITGSLPKRAYDTGETIDLTVTVRDANGNAVSDKSVSAELNRTEPIETVATASGSTDSSGEVTLSMSSNKAGFHFIKVTVGQQEKVVGLRISDVTAQLEDSSGNPVTEYEAEPGTTQTIHVSAKNADDTAITDDSQVTAYVTVFDDTIKLGTAKTTSGDASIDFKIPPSVPAREYQLFVEVVESGGPGTGTTSGTLKITGANAYQIAAKTDQRAYSPGQTATLTAKVTTGDGSPVSGKSVDLVTKSEGTAAQRVATVTTNSDGVAEYDYTIPSGASDGEYVLKTALSNSQSVQAFSGYRVRSIDVAVDAEDGPFNPGDTVSLTLYTNNSATGDTVSATSGSLSLALPGSNVEKSLSLSGSSPYSVSLSLPDDSRLIGSRSLSVTASKNKASDTTATLIDIESDTETANLSVSRPVTAGESTTVTVTGSLDTTGVLTAFSPNAGSVAHNSSVSVSSTSETTKSITIDTPGTYVVKLSVPTVGTITRVVDVEPASSAPAVWTGTSVSGNATSFSTGEDIYIKTNKPGMTATLVSPDTTYTVALNEQSGDTHYGVLSKSRASSVYMVRLDSGTATNVDNTIIEVN